MTRIGSPAVLHSPIPRSHLRSVLAQALAYRAQGSQLPTSSASTLHQISIHWAFSLRRSVRGMLVYLKLWSFGGRNSASWLCLVGYIVLYISLRAGILFDGQTPEAFPVTMETRQE